MDLCDVGINFISIQLIYLFRSLEKIFTIYIGEMEK